MSRNALLACAMISGTLTATWQEAAFAYEAGYSGFLQGPGSYINVPATTPPPGLYGSIISDFSGNTLVGPGAPVVNGLGTNANVLAPLEFLQYVPGFKILGGAYSITVGQQESFVSIGSPVNKASSGIHNSSITNSLGYAVTPDLFAKINLGVFIPDGTITGANSLGNAGYPFFGFVPRLTTTYSFAGLTFNNNIDAELLTNNTTTGYHSGNVFRETASLTKTFGRLTIGPTLEYIAQVTGDTSTGYYKNAINTNRYELLSFGAIVGYDFGPVSLAVYGQDESFAHASGGTPRTPGGPDTAVTFGGYSAIAQVSFKFPGIGALGDTIDYGALRTPLGR